MKVVVVIVVTVFNKKYVYMHSSFDSYAGFDHVQDKTFTRNLRNLVIHISWSWFDDIITFCLFYTD